MLYAYVENFILIAVTADTSDRRKGQQYAVESPRSLGTSPRSQVRISTGNSPRMSRGMFKVSYLGTRSYKLSLFSFSAISRARKYKLYISDITPITTTSSSVKINLLF